MKRKALFAVLVTYLVAHILNRIAFFLGVLVGIGGTLAVRAWW